VNYPRSIPKLVRNPVARKLYLDWRLDGAVIGSSVDLVRYNSTLILSSKRKLDQGEMISFICPSFFNGVDLGTNWSLQEATDGSEDWIYGTSHHGWATTTLLGRGGAQFSACDSPAIAPVTCRLEVIPECNVRVLDHKYNTLIAQGPLVALFAITSIPAGFSL
jgi:hypothetical protein